MNNQEKKAVKIPKEMPANIIIKPDDDAAGERGGLAGKHAPAASSKETDV